jgi:hypothetical protein
MVNSATFAAPGAPVVALAAAFMVLAGFPSVALNAASHGILQIETADAFRGRVFGALSTIQGLSTLLGLALGGLAIGWIGLVPVLSIGALMWVVGGVVALFKLPEDAGVPAGDEPDDASV